MPWTLYRYILFDLVKLLALTTLVLVLLIAFAAAIKPLSDGVLSPAALLKYVVYLVPTMLPFALPFAGAFAGTLVFSRMTSDNEILACSASGMSYWTILMPVMTLGLVLTLSMFYLSGFVLPRFYQGAERMLQKDLIHLLISQVERGQTAHMKDWALYARAVETSDRPPLVRGDLQPERMILLGDVAVGQVDPLGNVRSESTAKQADVLIFRDRSRTLVTLRLHDATRYDPERGELMFVKLLELQPIELPSPFKDNPRFLTWGELRDHGQEPEQYDQVQVRMARLAETIAAERFRRELETRLSARGGDGVVDLLSPRPQTIYMLKAPIVQRRGDPLVLLASDSEAVRLEYRESGVIRRHLEARRAELKFSHAQVNGEPRFTIDFTEVAVFGDASGGKGTERGEFSEHGVYLDKPLAEDMKRMNARELLSLAHQHFPEDADVRAADRALRAQIIRLARNIIAQLHQRAAAAVTCMLALLLGAVLAIRLRGTMALIVFFGAFMLVTLAVIITGTGTELTTDRDYPVYIGPAVIWSGAALVAAAVAITFRKLKRN